MPLAPPRGCRLVSSEKPRQLSAPCMQYYCRQGHRGVESVLIAPTLQKRKVSCSGVQMLLKFTWVGGDLGLQRAGTASAEALLVRHG